jgi:hypothetical protein
VVTSNSQKGSITRRTQEGWRSIFRRNVENEDIVVGSSFLGIGHDRHSLTEIY